MLPRPPPLLQEGRELAAAHGEQGGEQAQTAVCSCREEAYTAGQPQQAQEPKLWEGETGNSFPKGLFTVASFSTCTSTCTIGL